jgi:putative intracellular protease/amidase
MPAVGVSGTRMIPDLSLSEAHAKGHAAVIFIGGPGTPSPFHSGQAHRLARETARGEGSLGAICPAPAILARAGVLNGKRATTYPTAAEDLEVGGAHYTGAAVEVDGNMMTTQRP